MKNKLLENIYYGNEIHDLDEGTEVLRQWMKLSARSPSFGRDLPWNIIKETIFEFISRQHADVFGGQITAGDAAVIAAYMAAVRPHKMIEIGVASGYSSAFILIMANRLCLLKDEPFLYSFDLVAKNAAGQVTGSLLTNHYPELVQHWLLHTETTSADLVARPQELVAIGQNETVLAFVDGEHNHPWPAFDLLVLREILPRDSFVVMQDVQMMERWLEDCIIYGVPSPRAQRGVNLAYSMWPGTKMSGFGLCYNSSVVRMDISNQQSRAFAQSMIEYAHEISFDHLNKFRSFAAPSASA